jgi:hypothetical protein
MLADFAARILETTPLRVLDTELRLRRVQRGRTDPPGEVLVSWPPLTETCQQRKNTWTELWAIQLHVRIVTIAWDPRPYVAVEWSRRRFLSRPVIWVPNSQYRQRVRALAWWPASTPLKVSGVDAGDRLVEAALRWTGGPTSRGMTWDDATGRLLDRLDLDLNRERVDLNRLPNDPLYCAPTDGRYGLLVGYRHGIDPVSGLGNGFWQVDHCLLYQAVDAALVHAGFSAAPALGPPSRPRLRPLHKPHIAGCIEVWTQNDRTLEAILDTIADVGGDATETVARNSHRTLLYQGGALKVEARPVPPEWAQPLAELASPNRDEVQDAVAQRAAVVRGDLPERHSETVAIVELPPKAAWRNRIHQDPYLAVKRGFVTSGRGVQGLEVTEGLIWRQAETRHRAKHATLDAIRQLGVQLRFPEAIDPVPGGVRQVTILPVARNETSPGPAGVFPIVLMVDRDGSFHGLAFGDRELQPLPDLIRRFGTGDVEPLEPGNRTRQLRQWDSFVDDVVQQLIDGPPTLLLLERNKIWWPNLADKNIEHDVFTTPLSTHDVRSMVISTEDAPNLRLARIDTDTARHVGTLIDGNVPTTHGVYRTGERRFLSRGHKPKTRQVSENRSTFRSHLRKTTRRGRSFEAGTWHLAPRDPFGDGWNPSTVEILLHFLQRGDDPEAWANYIHGQRHVAIQFSDPLQVPAVMHNARLAQEHLQLVDARRPTRTHTRA